MGYDMPVGENGDFLSSGQRQAVMLARTLICNCPFYLLDEPTADLDTHLEQEFINRAKEFFQNSTVVLSTHRTALLELVDRIIVVGNQQVIADGNRDEVLSLLKQSKTDKQSNDSTGNIDQRNKGASQ
jgi:ATP-binding cassette subfamily C protein LapB